MCFHFFFFVINLPNKVRSYSPILQVKELRLRAVKWLAHTQPISSRTKN